MKHRIGPAIILIVIATVPSLAVAAEASPAEQGSWLMLLYFAINFAIFVGGGWYFAGPMVRQYFADRAKGIRDTIARSDRAFVEAENFSKRSAARIAQLEADKKALADEMDRETAFQINRLEEIARETVARLRRDAQQSG